MAVCSNTGSSRRGCRTAGATGAIQFAANGNPTTSLPVFMINNHRVDSVADADAYVARLIEAERVMGEISTTLRARAAAGA